MNNSARNRQLVWRHWFASLQVAILIGVAPLASAELVYTFSTTSLAPLAGPVNGYFVVPDSAILDGFITASEITSFRFVVSSVMPPFAPAIFATPDHLVIFSPFAGAMAVDPLTGNFMADSSINITDATTSQLLGLTTFPGSIPPLVPQYVLVVGPNQTQGSGRWTVAPMQPADGATANGIPALTPTGLVATAALILLAYALNRRRTF